MLSTKEITKLYKGTKITLRVDLYKTTKSGSKSSTGVQGSSVAKFRKLKKFAGCKTSHLAGLRNFATCCEIFATCEISQVANFRNPAKFPLCLPSLLHFCSKSLLVLSCIFEFDSGSSCLNQIEDNEVFFL